MFDELKAAQVAAFFLKQSQGRINVLKLVKLMYLSERESYRRFGEPLTGDRLVSMDHGPVLSRTLNYINGATESAPGGWESWIEDRAGHELRLRKAISSAEDLDRLSDAELGLLRDVWSQFGPMDKYVLRDWTHDNCPEWKDPDGSSEPIRYETLLAELGYNAEQTREVMDRIREMAIVRAAISRCG
jgi:uncharacterized phage-associated protein